MGREVTYMTFLQHSVSLIKEVEQFLASLHQDKNDPKSKEKQQNLANNMGEDN